MMRYDPFYFLVSKFFLITAAESAAEMFPPCDINAIPMSFALCGRKLFADFRVKIAARAVIRRHMPLRAAPEPLARFERAGEVFCTDWNERMLFNAFQRFQPFVRQLVRSVVHFRDIEKIVKSEMVSIPF